MILSFKHRYIFLHCRKTAGTSIAVSLARDLGPNDFLLSGVRDSVLHGIKPPDATMERARAVGGWRLAASRIRGKDVYARRLAAAVRKAHVPLLGPKPPHPPISRVRDAFPGVFDPFFKFCVVRNPWDRVVSDYYWLTRRLDERPTFEAWMHSIAAGVQDPSRNWHTHYDNWPMYADGDQILVDRIIRFEALTEDLKAALSEADIPFDGWLPRSKSAFRKHEGQQGYRDLHTSETKAIVERLYQREINAFGYDY